MKYGDISQIEVNGHFTTVSQGPIESHMVVEGQGEFCPMPITVNYSTCIGGHGGRVVTLLPPTSEAGVRFPAWPQVGKLVVGCRWSAVYSTEP